MSSQQPLTQGGHLTFGDSDDDDELFNEEMCALLGSTVATLRGGAGGPDAPPLLPPAAVAPQAPPLAPQEGPRGAALQPQPAGLKWNAAGSLVRAVQQGRQQVGQQPGLGLPGALPQQQSLPQHAVPYYGVQHPAPQQQQPPPQQPPPQQLQQQRPPVHVQPGVQTATPGSSFQSYHQSNSHQTQHSAQMTELQRQVEQYKQQLMFAQQELNEVRRARRGTTVVTGNAGQQYEVLGTAMHRRVDQTKEIAPDDGKGNGDSPSANNKRQRGQSTPPSVSVSTYNTTKDTLMSIVPRFMGQLKVGIGAGVAGSVGEGHHVHADYHSVPLTYRLDRLERDIAYLKQYRIKRAEIFSILDEHQDVSGSVLVNLEAALSSGLGVPGAVVRGVGESETWAAGRRPNVKDITIMLLSVLTYVLGTDADMVLDRLGKHGGANGTAGVAHPVLLEYNTNATGNSATIAGVFPTEVMCTSTGTAAPTVATAVGAGQLGKHGNNEGPSRKEAQRCAAAFFRFVGSFFTVLNEFSADSNLLVSMIDELTEDDTGVDGDAQGGAPGAGDIVRPSKRAMSRNILRTMEVLSTAEPSSSPGLSLPPGSASPASTAASPGGCAMEALAKFLHALARVRSKGGVDILVPVLQSKQLEKALLAYPGASRDELIKFVLVMLEDKQTLASMELEASKELQIPPSRRATSAAQLTPPKATGGISGVARPRRHSMLNKRLGIDSDTKSEGDRAALQGDPFWASRLTQTINLCLDRPSAPAPWTTVRLCLEFFASLVERSAEALLQSVCDFKHLEKYSDDGREVETLMHHVVRVAGMAAGEGSLLHPNSCSETDAAEQRSYLRRWRIVHESLVLLRALLSRVPGTARCLALEDSNGVLCVLEKIAIGYPLSTLGQPMLSGGRLALWVDALDAAYGRRGGSCDSIARSVKGVILKQLASISHD